MAAKEKWSNHGIFLRFPGLFYIFMNYMSNDLQRNDGLQRSMVMIAPGEERRSA
jgi:hypothetical protein